MIPDEFLSVNVIDTCAVWNLISSDTLFRASLRCRHTYVATQTVIYECLLKPRTRPPKSSDAELKSRLESSLSDGRMSRIDITIEDLREVASQSSRLGRGELSCAAAARKINQAVMTDNRRDFKGISALIDGRLQTTPRLLGWLVLEGHLGDSESRSVVVEHESLGGTLGKAYGNAYTEACEKRLQRQLEVVLADSGED